MGDSCESNEHLQHLARRPSRYARSYKGYFVNGYKFHTVTHAAGRVTHNSGVYVRGTNYDDSELEGDYYGLLEDVLEVDFFGHNVVVLFKCTWFDTPGGVRVDRKHGLVDIKHKSRLRSDDPFVLASQAEQVYYTPYPSVAKELKDWWAVVKTKPRGIYAVVESATGVDDDDDDDDDDDEQFFQINERVTSTTSTEPNEDLNSVSLATGEATFVATHSEQEDVSENDASDDEEEFEDTDDDDDNEDAFILSDHSSD